MNEQERYQRYLAGREWGLKKEAVRMRCHGICERCMHFPMSHVHHLTYIRKYNELLEDLQGLCIGCHEFTHGKADHDPRMDVPVKVCGQDMESVYLAGKITGSDWRDGIVENRSVVRLSSFEDIEEYDHGWPTHFDGIVLSDGRTLDYSGPFRVTVGGHSWGWAKHAFGEDHDFACLDNAITSLDVPRFCRSSIDHTDLIFAWIDSLDCYGTLVEIGYANAKGKPILIAGPKFFPELWFIYALANRIAFCPDDVIKDVFEMMVLHNGGHSFSGWRASEADPDRGLDPIDGRYWEEDECDEIGPDDDNKDPDPILEHHPSADDFPDGGYPYCPPGMEPTP